MGIYIAIKFYRFFRALFSIPVYENREMQSSQVHSILSILLYLIFFPKLCLGKNPYQIS